MFLVIITVLHTASLVHLSAEGMWEERNVKNGQKGYLMWLNSHFHGGGQQDFWSPITERVDGIGLLVYSFSCLSCPWSIV